MTCASGSIPREVEAALLLGAIAAGGATLILVTGPRGAGKTHLVRSVLAGIDLPTVHLDTAFGDEAAMRRSLEREAREVLGDLPEVPRPGLLPVPGAGVAWVRLLDGVFAGLSAGPGGVLVLDGLEALRDGRRRLGRELAEAMGPIRRAGGALRLVLVGRDPERFADWVGEDGALGPPEVHVEVGAVPFREAGWRHGARDGADAFAHWAVFGDHTRHLAPHIRPAAGPVEAPPGRTPTGAEPGVDALGEAVVRRILDPAGDLFDAPLRWLETAFQAPGRYAAILSAVAEEDREWGGIAGALGAEVGNRIAPYLRRLEAEGLLDVQRPLDAPPRSRRSRYAPRDPFTAFWFGQVLPHRSALLRLGPERVWAERIRPSLQPHLDRWLPEAARRWLRFHARELMPAEAREAGGLWGGVAELEVVGRLTNGQICYGMCQRGSGTADVGLLDRLHNAMAATRYGIGREVRTPLVFVQGPASEPLRRGLLGDPPGSLVTLDTLMGAPSGGTA